MAQIVLLLWKNWLVQSRKICATICMIILPLIFFAMLLLLTVAVTFVGNVMVDHKRNNLTEIVLNGSVFGKLPKTVFAPKNTETQLLMDLFTSLMRSKFSQSVEVKGFLSEKEADEAVMKEKDTTDYTYVEFEGVTSTSPRLPHSMKVTIRPFVDGNPNFNTDRAYSVHTLGLEETRVEERQAVVLQILIAEALVNYWLGKNLSSLELAQLEVSTQAMTSKFNFAEALLGGFTQMLQLFLVLSFLISVIIITKTVVHEKEKKIKQSMKLMGLTPLQYWLSWFIFFGIYVAPILLLYTWAVCGKGAFISHSDASLFLVFLLCFGIAMITFCLMASTFFKKAGFGAMVTAGLFIAFYLFSSLFYQEDPQKRTKILPLIGSLMFTCAFHMGLRSMVELELDERGAHWSDMGYTIFENDLSFRTYLLMLLLDSALHVLIGWYVDNINPGEFGVPKPYLFCFSKSYWSSSNKPSDNIQLDQQQIPDNKYFQKLPQGTPIGIQVLKLTKVFGTNVAVSDISFDVPEGQITVLIGHNGAGKTTLISVLTGFIPPTSGTAFIGGYDIRKDLNKIHRILGVCPQHDILFDTLKVREHLKLFGRLKGCGGASLEQEINELADKTGLTHQMEQRSKFLSGGQKRKLSIAMAMIGGSQVVILDEPTSGVDPEARRQIWSLLHLTRSDRTILLTTQYMDEADILGEKIAIMAAGVLQCYGSSQFLKEVYGAGYHLTIVKKPNCKVDQLTQVVKTRIPSAQVENIVNTEVSYLLPHDVGGQLSELFTYLEDNKGTLNIVSYGITATTMDKVFFQVGLDSNDDTPGRSADPDENKSSSELVARTPTPRGQLESKLSKSESRGSVNNNAHKMSAVDQEIKVKVEQLNQEVPAFNQGFVKKTDMALLKSRVTALVIKKLIITRRTWLFALFQIVIPVTIFALFTIPSEEQISYNVKFICNLNMYDKTAIPYTDGAQPNDRATLFKDVYALQFGGDQDLEYFSGNEHKFINYTQKRLEELGNKAFKRKVVIGMEVISDIGEDNLSVVAYFNVAPFHSELVSVNYVMNAYLKFMLNDSFSLQTAFYPKLQDSTLRMKNKKKVDSSVGMGIAVSACISLSFLTAMFSFNPIKERQVGAKQLQFISGVGPLTYWLTIFVWDFIIFMVASLPLYVVMVVYEMDVYLDDGRWFLVILILVAHAWAALPMVYAVSFIFKTPAGGLVGLFTICLVIGVVESVNEIYYMSGDRDDVVVLALEYIAMVFFPMANLVEAFMSIPINEENKRLCQTLAVFCAVKENYCCKDTCGDKCILYEINSLSLRKYGIGRSLLVMSCQGVIYFLVLLLIEDGSFFFFNRKTVVQDYDRRVQVKEDSDVAAERMRITSTPISNLLSTDLLVLMNLSKRYQSFLVKPICLGIPKQEIFGLLGQNGAGKSTVFKMLVGEVKADSGNVYLSGFDINSNKRKVQTNVGYCPQFDGLIDGMTGKENLFMYARIRGIPESEIPRVVDDLIARLVILPDGDTQAKKLSGGNKRKLSVAIALIGDPLFILLDEPSSGMDPAAKRQLWSALSSVRASGRTLMLTSHSMEECEALCSRLAIMVKGTLLCLGSSQYLKNKFGQGFSVVIKLAIMENGNFAPAEPVINFINTNFRNSKVFDDNHGYLHVQILDTDLLLATVFSIMESAKTDQIVADYSVQQTTLEQIFLTFIRMQETPDDPFFVW